MTTVLVSAAAIAGSSVTLSEPISAATAQASSAKARAALAARSSRHAPAISPAPAPRTYASIFIPPAVPPATVEAPSPRQAVAFTAVNAFFGTVTRFGQAIVGMRVALDRAAAAARADDQLWSVRQANASADFALQASQLLERFPALQAALAAAFAADKMTLAGTSGQVATGPARLGAPTPVLHLLGTAAAAFQPATVPEVAAMRAAILDTSGFERAVNSAPGALALPAGLSPGSVAPADALLAGALKSYANTLLQPVPAGAYLPALRSAFAGGDQVAGALSCTSENFDALSAGYKSFGGEAGRGAAESLEPLGQAFGYAFAAAVFWQVGKEFSQGGGAGGGEGNGAGGGERGCSPSDWVAGTFGDPHQLTFSGADYDFQAAGEFTLIKSTTDNLDVQVRLQPFPGSAEIAVNTATAMQVAGSVVELASSASGDLQLFVNHRAVPLASRVLAGGGYLTVDGPGSAVITWPDGTQLSVFSIDTGAAHTPACDLSHALSIVVTAPRWRLGQLEGLLGDPGGPPGELVGGNGLTYSMDQLGAPWQNGQNFDVLYHQFGQSWRVSHAASLFYYPKGLSTASFMNSAFPSKVFTVSSLTPTSAAAAEADCKQAGVTSSSLLADCVYDVGVTGASGTCFARADARVQATAGRATAKDLPQSSGPLPPAAKAPATPPPASTAGVAWVRVNGGTNSSNQVGTQLGLARTADGVLHVIWDRGTSDTNGKTAILQTLISPAGKLLGTSTVASGWAGLAGGNALVIMPDKTLRLFVSGGYPHGGGDGINVLTAPPNGQAFTRDPSALWGGEVAGASPFIAATLSHGQIVTAWSDGQYNVGLAPTPKYPSIYSYMSVPQLSTDAKTGAVVLSGLTNSPASKGGVYIQQVLPHPGPGELVSSNMNTDPGASGATARIGAAGVYVLTANANAKVLALTRYGAGRVVIATGGGYYYANVFAAPDGRLWVAWWPSTGNDLFVTRSNMAVSRFEAVQTLPLPASSQLDDSPFYGNGSAGPLDLFPRLTIGPVSGFLVTHVLGLLTVHSSVVPVTSKKGKVIGEELKVFVSDAGDPVPGATVAAGRRHAMTRVAGVANFSYAGTPTGQVAITVTAPGYRPVTTSASL